MGQYGEKNNAGQDKIGRPGAEMLNLNTLLDLPLFCCFQNCATFAQNMSAAFFHLLQPVVHYGLHFLFPGLIAWLFFRPVWKKAWLVMLATMLVDLDHLLADPIFDPGRCSIGYHPLHSGYAIGVYAVLFCFPKTRIIATGLLLHILTDLQDCWWTRWLAGA